jgi:hypothetical protein
MGSPTILRELAHGELIHRVCTLGVQQMARNATMEGWGALRHCRYLLHDRDMKYSAAFRARGLCDVANGSAGSGAITIKKRRELAGQAIMKPTFGGYRVRLTVRKFARGTVGQAVIDGQSRGDSRAKTSRSSHRCRAERSFSLVF